MYTKYITEIYVVVHTSVLQFLLHSKEKMEKVCDYRIGRQWSVEKRSRGVERGIEGREQGRGKEEIQLASLAIM